ncbi:hypothetical protein CDL12_00723 [Handroanthus impetiginosus]|uniref:Secreted protein n=1 Tax=Handroanthus impetiginosus TaxID=429701 RepID=A0A2G9IA35_9LAMI|nr:hypothetical protein CDL12_00723 [Handroanthus impetiginosus]
MHYIKYFKALIVTLPQGLLACSVYSHKCDVCVKNGGLGDLGGELTSCGFAGSIKLDTFHHWSFCSSSKVSGAAYLDCAECLEPLGG